MHNGMSSIFYKDMPMIYIIINTIAFFSSDRYPVRPHTFVSPSADSRRAVVSYWGKYVHEVLVNCLGGLILPRESVVQLTDCPNMTIDVYRGQKTTTQLFSSVLNLRLLAMGSREAILPFFTSLLTQDQIIRERICSPGKSKCLLF